MTKLVGNLNRVQQEAFTLTLANRDGSMLAKVTNITLEGMSAVLDPPNKKPGVYLKVFKDVNDKFLEIPND